MKVADILRIKGSAVKTVPSHETALLLSERLRAERIGALIVSNDGRTIDGIISERDLAYGLATHGSMLPKIPVSELMTKAVIVCSPEDSITDVIKLMIQRRIRHLPVKDNGQHWELSASAISSNTGSARYNWKRTCFATTPWLLGISETHRG
jgi:CBS domain-containing protein